MGDDQHRLLAYLSRLVSGLVACAVVAVTLHSHVAAATILAAVMLLVIVITALMHRGAI